MTPRRPVRVVQFGQGVFLRAFVDWMIHRLNHEAGQDIGVALVQPRDGDEVARLMQQQGRYPLELRGVEGGVTHSREMVIDCVVAGVNTHDDPVGFRTLAVDPDVEVVISNTTEAGIVYRAEDGALAADERALVRSFPGKLTWFLAERHAALGDGGGLVILPCELIEDNGQELRSIVQRLATDWALGPDFDRWLAERVTFCDTLVDRIVPGHPEGHSDPFAVTGEWYHSWVIRDPAGSVLPRLPLDLLDLNVTFADDLKPHRDLKVRTLNGTHTAMTPVAYLAGFDEVGQAVADPAIREFVTGLMQDEILPTIGLPDDELAAFAASVLDRFANPFVRHALLSISLNGTSKVRARLLPILRDHWAAGNPAPRRLASAIAAFIAFNGESRAGQPIPVSDDPGARAAFRELWRQRRSGVLDDPGLVRAVAEHPDLFGSDGAWPDPFVRAVAESLPAHTP